MSVQLLFFLSYLNKKPSKRQWDNKTALYTVLFLLNKLKAPKKSEKLKTGASVSLCTFKTYLNFLNRL